MSAEPPTTDFRGHTCGECAWFDRYDHISDGFCRRVAFGFVDMDKNTGRYYCLGHVSQGHAACPAFVPLEEEEDQ